MRSFFILLLVILFCGACITACAPAAGGGASPSPTAPASASADAGPAVTRTSTLTPMAPPESTAAATATAEAVAAATSTPTAPPPGLIQVDTLEQEVYPFVENGKCSLGEAIIAANSGQAVDSCAAGSPGGGSLIELMPGTYRLSAADHTPQQGNWAYSFNQVPNGLPAVVLPLTIRGNGARIARQDAAEPFRLLEILYGETTLQDLTLAGGDAGPDEDGGAVYVAHGSLALEGVTLQENHARRGGGVYLMHGALTIQASAFSSNRSSVGGGAIYATDASVEVRASSFRENVSEEMGGGLFTDRTTLVIEDSLFQKNIALDSRGGAVYTENVNLSVLRNQFYQNEARLYGGAVYVGNMREEREDEVERDPLADLAHSETYTTLATQIPGFQATLQADPSGVFQKLEQDAQVHHNCFAGNQTHDPLDPNWTSALYGPAYAEENYYGHPSGPGGMGPGQGDMVGKWATFAPFLTEAPDTCDQAPAP